MDCCGKRKSRIRRWSWVALAIVVGAIVAAVVVSDARGDDAATEPPAANTMCPVMTDEAIDPEQWVEYQGQRVYFCCRMCKPKFQRDPEAYLANLPQFALAVAAAVPADADAAVHGAHEHNDAAAPHDDAGHDDAGHDDADHDHASHDHADDAGGLMKLAGWLGNFHPPATDFPVALLIAAALAEVLFIVTGRIMFTDAARFCVWLGCLGAIGATVLGWLFAGFHLSDPDWVMTVHRWLGTAAGAWSVVVLVLCIAAHRGDAPAKARVRWYRLALFIGAAAVAANGFFGGAMVYGLDHYAW